MKHIIEDAEKIFSNAGGELLLRQCSSENNRNVFYVKGINGKVISIKKSTMLWMLSSGRFKRSNDRLRRFHQIRMLAPKDSSNQNCIKHEISTGDWIALQGPIVCHVTNFQYQTGKLKTCPLTTVPRECPANVEKRGIFLLGNFYTVSSVGCLSVNNKKHLKSDIDHYVTHIKAPNSKLSLSSDTLSYLQTYKLV
nr:uncharacterized protein LOC115266905 [Aedes albopictus]